MLEWTLRRGVSSQIDEFKKGFSSGPLRTDLKLPSESCRADSLALRTVFSVRDLQTFTPVELVMMTASVDEDWSLESELTPGANATLLEAYTDRLALQPSRTRPKRTTASPWTAVQSATSSRSCRNSRRTSGASSSRSSQGREFLGGFHRRPRPSSSVLITMLYPQAAFADRRIRCSQPATDDRPQGWR